MFGAKSCSVDVPFAWYAEVFSGAADSSGGSLRF